MNTTAGAFQGSPLPEADERSRLQRQARALGNPTRFAMFEYVARLHGPVQVSTLVEHFGLNHNVIRQHLAKLCEADLFVEEFAPRTGPGRPALQYRLAPDVSGRWGASVPYERLAGLLLEMAAEGLSPLEVGRRAGRQAAVHSDGQARGPVERLMAELRNTGAEPRVLHGPDGIDLVLNPGPFAQVGPRHRQIVCDLHRGLAEGLLEGLGSDLEVGGLEVGTAGNAACTLRLHRGASAGS